MTTLLTLTCPGLPDLALTADSGIRVTAFDMGWPETRRVSEPMPGADGTIDSTRLHGARVVTITATITGTADVSSQDVLTMLGAFCSPGLRPTLLIETPGRPSRAIDLCVDQWSSPLVGGELTRVQVSWVAPSGVIRSAAPHVVRVPVRRTAVVGGRAYDWTPSRTYPHAEPTGLMSVENLGSLPAAWRLRLYGYAKHARFEVDGRVLVGFNLGPIPQGSFWEVDSAQRTVLEDASPAASRRNVLDFVASTWASLPPGESTVTYHVTDPSALARAELEWFDQWLI